MPSEPRDRRPAPKAPELLADRLREEILGGSATAGQPLREEELARTHEVSRHTVRTALAQLAEERLVTLEPYRGARVTEFDDAATVSLQELRGALEAEAVRILHDRYDGRWPRAVRAPIDAAVAALSEAEREGDWLAVTRAHSAVHTAMVAAAGSTRITEAYRRLDSETLLLITQVRPHYPSGSLEAEHRAYLAAVETGDTDAVRAHLAHTTDLVRAGRAAGA